MRDRNILMKVRTNFNRLHNPFYGFKGLSEKQMFLSSAKMLDAYEQRATVDGVWFSSQYSPTDVVAKYIPVSALSN